MTIAIVYSLPTKRSQTSSFLIADEDTVLSAQKIARALETKGVNTELVGLRDDRITETISAITADLIINLVDWTGPDLPLSFIAMDALTSCGIPFAGATKENFLFVDKTAMKTALVAAGIPTPRFLLFRTGEESISPTFPYPALVKLGREHCSIGLEKTSFVHNVDELKTVVRDRLKRFGQDVYVEEFVGGTEYQITVLQRVDGPVMLPPAEITYKPTGKTEFLTFAERWDETDPDYFRSNTVLAELSSDQLHAFEHICLNTFRALGFRDFTRIDGRLNKNNELLVLEANPNPGLDDDELYSMTISAKAVGLSFPDFIWEIVQSVLRRSSSLSSRSAESAEWRSL